MPTKHDNELDLLKNLLDTVYSKNLENALDLHLKKNSLILILHDVYRFEKVSPLNSEQKTLLTSIKEKYKELSEDLRQVEKAMYPKAVVYMGLCPGLRQYLSDTGKKHKLLIDYTEDVPKELPIDKTKQVGVYLLCVEIVEYFLLAKNKRIHVEVKADKASLQIAIHGKNPLHVNKKDSKLEDKVHIIKGLFLWQNIQPNPSTDFLKTFIFTVKKD